MATKFTELRRLHKAVEYIRRNAHPDFALSQLSILLFAQERGGVTQTELMDLMEMPSGSISRNARELSQYLDKGKLKGYDFVRLEPDLYERRRLRVVLTAKGEHFLKALDGILSQQEVVTH